MRRRTPGRRIPHLRSSAIAASTVAIASLLHQAVAYAYEWVDGPAKTCGGAGYEVVVIQAYIYGDWNLYSNYGREAFGYNIPETQLTYAFASTAHGSVTDTDAEAGDAGGFVDGPVGVDCGPK